MFRIEFFVEDKNLHKVLHGVAGMALNLKADPVANAKIEKGRVKAETGGTLTEVAARALKGRSEVTTKELGDIAVANGRQHSSSGYIATQLKELGLIKPGKKHGTYIVTKKG